MPGEEIIDNLGFDTVEEGVDAALAKGRMNVLCLRPTTNTPNWLPQPTVTLSRRAEFVVAGAPRLHGSTSGRRHHQLRARTLQCVLGNTPSIQRQTSLNNTVTTAGETRFQATIDISAASVVAPNPSAAR